MKLFHAVLNSTDLCVVFLLLLQVSQNVNDMCAAVFPPTEPTGKMVAKEPHQVHSLCLDIHLGNSKRAIIPASS